MKAAEKVGLHDLNWSGGTRMVYTVYTLDGQRVSDTARYSVLAPWNNRAEGVQLPIPEGFVVVETGCFCGRDSTAVLHVHPANMPKLLPGTEVIHGRTFTFGDAGYQLLLERRQELLKQKGI